MPLQVKVCPQCHKIFIPTRSNQQFCCKKCRDKSLNKRMVCICDYCGKEFTKKRSDFERSKTHFCSTECRYNAIRWKESDIKILKENYGKIPTSELQSMLLGKHSVKAICRKAQLLGLAKDPHWTKEEDIILEANYGEIPMDELMALLPGRSENAILDRAHNHHILSKDARLQYSDEDVEFLKENYLTMSNAQLAKAIGRTVDGISLKLYDLRLVRPFDVKSSSYPDLEKFVRRRLSGWINQAREEFDYACSVTGSKENIEVHHIRSFNLLMEETCELLDFPECDDFNQYTEEQLELFMNTFLEVQEKYHSYTCVNRDVHKLFHTEYGYGDNTQEQWDEFVQKYKDGYYDDVA